MQRRRAKVVLWRRRDHLRFGAGNDGHIAIGGFGRGGGRRNLALIREDHEDPVPMRKFMEASSWNNAPGQSSFRNQRALESACIDLEVLGSIRTNG